MRIRKSIAAITVLSTALLAGLGATMVFAQPPQPSQPVQAAEPAQYSQSGATAVTVVSESVPAALAVPAGQRLVASMRVVEGAQVYQCAAGKWTLLEPDAVLRSGNTLVLHSRGPQWTSAVDGSSVTGALVASAARQGAVPELLLRATSNRGDGLLSGVDLVHRLDTVGGVAPTTSCAAGAQQAVPYRAEYRFYVRA